ncbi:pentapeptide repeat-containing protein, partial [Staphylococcus saprophyticus]|uniref:pentapeptide repeat-containing protein n=1 Tax=Staphylococcus saprophyticus TaxID=29385 RepID=UPI0028A571F7
PKINVSLDYKILTDVFDDEDDILEQAAINHSNFVDQTLDRLLIYGSRITNCNFTNSDIGRVDFTDVIFENCDFSNVKMEHGSLHRVIFKKLSYDRDLFKTNEVGSYFIL